MQPNRRLPRLVLSALTILTPALRADDPPNPTFAEVTVHDPSVIKVGARWYVYGSHGASAELQSANKTMRFGFIIAVLALFISAVPGQDRANNWVSDEVLVKVDAASPPEPTSPGTSPLASPSKPASSPAASATPTRSSIPAPPTSAHFMVACGRSRSSLRRAFSAPVPSAPSSAPNCSAAGSRRRCCRFSRSRSTSRSASARRSHAPRRKRAHSMTVTRVPLVASTRRGTPVAMCWPIDAVR